ncbi:MAG: NAD(P)H-dependent glycerol-3-phosphate dehydrogenase [Vicingaceae bacterium]|jgi:glycerol-3-phosphate dehydrogenase (NAD(P)+)|nr:NAD(P)H-dependent glycerol-3-phosphate dehydrogenase [Flavobacteriales bacterium]MBQ21760.1 glycerol-3-phosphate dehydrogenase [Flavobacteriales bacterium]MDF1676285.1 NAD(P)H-dependent glycerol-3-phosphate dehydrogenase [Vicingaceae bacterium]|tara:strand:+ start:76389 stop:77384 length:996 start_codon:yes stop_codon:yes gene_type:complete
MENQRIAVLGGGSWATAIVKILTENLSQVNWWMRDAEAIQHIEKFDNNPRYLPAIQFETERLNMNTNLQEIVDQSDILIVAVPSAFIAKAFDEVNIKGIENKIIISAIKGVIPEYNQIPAEYFHVNFNVPYNRIGMIAGPCHAEEVAMERLSYLTIACENQEIAEYLAGAMSCRYINTTTSDDLFGTELSAILKNVYAVASGICHGLGYGDNFQAVLIACATRETKNFIDAIHPIHRDVNSSAYLGDLLVTAYSQFSRNRNFGSMVGKGYSVRSAQIEMNMVAEGYYAAKGIYEINKKYNVELPIVDAVYHILYEKISPIMEMKILTGKLS